LIQMRYFDNKKSMTKNAKRLLLPFAILIGLILFVYIANLHTIFSLNWLREEHMYVENFVHAHPVLSPLIYIGFYIFSVCLVIPDSTILAILGGFVFPLPLAILYAVIAEGVGSLIFYRIFYLVFRLPGLRINRPIFQKIQRELKKYPVSYMLFLRVSHVIPFWTTNIVAAYFRVKNWTFLWTTFLGVLPLAYVLASAGHSLKKEIAISEKLTIGDIFTLQVKLALLILGILILAPLIYRHVFRRKRKL